MMVSHEKGITLVLALLLLLVMTVLGVAGLSSIAMQERMASNANLQALAFEAASAGVNDALDWAFEMKPDGTMKHWGVDDDNKARTCDRGLAGDEWTQPYGTEPYTYKQIANATVRFRTTLGCFLDAALLDDIVGDETLPMQLLLLSRGEVVNDGGVLAMREVEVRLEPIGDDATCLFTTGELDPGTLNEPNTNSTNGGVAGGPGGCALAVPPGNSKELFDTAMGTQRLSRWTPPPAVREQELEPLWNNAENLAKALNAIKFGIQAAEAWPNIAPDPDPDPLPNPFASCAGTVLKADPPSGNQVAVVDDCPVSGGIYYIAGSLEAKSGCNIRGTVLIEDGLYFSGQGQYGGLNDSADLMVFGGTLRINGFGTTRPNGLMTLLNLVEPADPLSFGPGYEPDDEELELDPTTFDIRGMGNALINQPTLEHCEQLVQKRKGLNQCLKDLSGLNGLNIGEKTVLEKYIEDFKDESLDFVTSVVDAGNFATDLAFWDEDDLATQFPIPRCAGDLAGKRVAISSWREYIDRARWEK